MLRLMLRAHLRWIIVVLVGNEALSCIHVVDTRRRQMIHLILMLVLAGTAAVRERVRPSFNS